MRKIHAFHFPFTWVITSLCLGLSVVATHAAPLTTLEHHITGQALIVSPAALSVPKGIAGSIAVDLQGSAAPAGAYVEATLRGPSFPARRLVGAVNQALLLPPLNLVGDYQLDNIRLVDGTSGNTLMVGSPSSVPVHVFDDVLISRVTSRPLSITEIQEKGIVIDDKNFRAVEFEVGFVLDGKTIPVKFPVIAPSFKQSTEIIPAAELEERLRQAEAINNELVANVSLPKELETANTNIQIKGLNFQAVEDGDQDLALHIPPIPALMIIPGNIGFLHQFFSVMIFTENGAPSGSGLSVHGVTAELVLPAGTDRTQGTYDFPGDDPLRFARVGSNAVIQQVQNVQQLGPDGKLGTADDVERLQPGETGQAEFLVEGLQEGLHVMDLKLKAKLDGLAAGIVNIEGKAAGSVLVRNPKFSMAFSHPRTVRFGEPYEAFVTILNTSQVPANLVSVSLNRNSISGGVLESDETVELGTLLPGQTAQAKFRVRAQRTGAITFSNLTTGDDSVVGRFRLHTGIDERGVELSADSFLLPDYVDELPPELVAAANRILGQALSSATAGQVPAGVIKVGRSFMRQKALELAEAGQRLRYGETLATVLPDLLLDWQGARDFSDGWDQIMRETNAGQEWREAMMRAMEAASPARNAPDRLALEASNLAGRGEAWWIASSSVRSDSELTFTKSATQQASLGKSSLPKGLGYLGSGGAWLVSAVPGVIQWKFPTAVATPLQLSLAMVQANGTATELRWPLPSIDAGACVSYDATGASELLSIDDNCDGTVDRTLAALHTNSTELPPIVLAVRQDPSVSAGRPPASCVGLQTTNEDNDDVNVANYANVLAVLFSKPMTQIGANVPSAYTLENGNAAAFVQIQPGGRVALLTMHQPVGVLVERHLSVAGNVKDVRGNALVTAPELVFTRMVEGITVRGRVVRADGSFAAFVPVTLTYYDELATIGGCEPWIRRVTQIFTNEAGEFKFDYVLAGLKYSISATDTSGLSAETIALILESTRGDEFNRAKLEELAASASVKDTLLAEFASGALTQAIAKAEGLDRALVRDFVVPGSSRVTTEAVFALRFRGRGSVTGQVLAADGVTPVNNAAVNLFPDPDSRELGRGVFSDSSGRFAFYGVPLGVFSIQATSPAGQTRVLADTLTTAGQIKDVSVVLSQSVPVFTELQGRVTEPDGTGHPSAQVFIGDHNTINSAFGNVVASATADSSGYWQVSNVPVGIYDPVAISADGKRKGERRNLSAVAGAVNTVNLTLQARATVLGRVETSTGIPVANAVVGGGETLVRTDALGRFTLTGVPTGDRSINAGLERNLAAGIDFPRLGRGSVHVLSGADNFVVVRLDAVGRIIGRVLDANGAPVPRASVAIPENGGFRWVHADAQGNYEFVGLKLGRFDLSSPAPPHETPFDADAAQSALSSGDQGQVLAAIGEAFAAFTGINNPLLNGEGATFNPLSWGFVKDVSLGFDGQTVIADIRHLRTGTIGGTVTNGQDVPIGARVRLTGVGPSLTGAPTMIIRGELNSDPALGTFSFVNQALVGDWGLQAASPFFPVVISASGRTTSVNPNATGIVLKFPAVRETNGSLSGTVLLPDGTPAGAGVDVQISFGPDFIIHTDAQGHFATQASTFTLPAGGYTVTATDLSTGGKGRTTVNVQAAQVNFVTVQLLGRGDADVLVKRADGTPVAGAAVQLQGGAYPSEFFEGTTNAQGHVVFANLFEGPYAVSAAFTAGLTRLSGRSGVYVSRDATGSAVVSLTPTGTVNGVFLARDGTTPIGFANISLGSLAFATTDANGRFSFQDVPLGSYRLIGTDAVTGRSSALNVTLAVVGEVREVQLVETALGEVTGFVVNGFGTGFVSNAEVSLSSDDPFFPARSVTTGPDGAFRFPGTPAGGFMLNAKDRLTGLSGQARGNLSTSATQLQLNVALQSLANLTVQVLETDGVTPATLATVRFRDLTADTNALGQARFSGVTLSSSLASIVAESRTVGFTRRWAGLFKLVNSQSAEETATLTLRGVGSVEGRVFFANGTTPAPGAEVSLTIGTESIAVTGGAMSKPSAGFSETVIADENGHFSFTNISRGDFRLAASSLALGASVTSTVTSSGQTVTQNLTLSASGTVIGRILRADGTTPAPGTNVLLTFASQSGLPGRANASTGSDGRFSIATVPVGNFHAEITNADVGGIAKRDSHVDTNNQTVNLGEVVLDEEFPVVTQVTPANTATGVSITTTIDLLFSEALVASSVEASGVFVRKATGSAPAVPATLTLSAPSGGTALRFIRLTPTQPLESETTYQIVVVDGDLVNAVNTVTNRGPRDLVGRALPALFSATFTTRDQRPPVVLSFTPELNAEQVDTRGVVRLSLDEPIVPGAVITLNGPGGAIAGTTSLGVNNLVLVFTPTTELPPNASFTASVSGMQDAAGNAVINQPRTTAFKTLDTLGPDLATLRIKNNQAPIAGSTITLEAVLVTPEVGARVRMTADNVAIGTSSTTAFEIPFTLPASGTIMVRAIGIDRFNNEGPFAELPITVQANLPPVISFSKLSPTTATVPSGSLVSVRVSATDDGGVSELRAAMSGALTLPLQTTTGAAITLQGTVPSTALPGSTCEVIALARDNSNLSTSEQSFQIAVSDGTAPVVAWASPATNTRAVAGMPFDLAVDWSDNSGAATMLVTLSGPVTGLQTRSVANPANQTKRETFSFDLSAFQTTGTAFTATVRVTDAAGFFTVQTRSFLTADLRAPQLTTIAPASSAVNQSLWSAGWTLAFDEPMNVALLTPANLTVTLGGVAVPATITSSSTPNTTVMIAPSLPLAPGSEYLLTVSTALRDAAGNPWLDVGGIAVPGAGRAFALTTAAITGVAPLVNTKIVGGQTITTTVNYESGLGANQWRFAFNSDAFSEVTAGSTQASKALVLPVNATTAVIKIHGKKTGNALEYAVADIVLDLRSRGDDDDSDGWLNGYEADRGMNPFTANLDSDDFDNDGLSNGQERSRGTDPAKADSDGDTLTDAAEVLAGTDPLDVDTDHDTLADNLDPRPLIPNVAPVANSDTINAFTNQAKIITIATDLLANDTDADGDVRVFVSFTQPNSGVLAAGASGQLIYTPAANFIGSTTFTYTIKDAANATSIATVTINVTQPNRQPTATGFTLTVNEDTTGIATLNGTDLDGDPLTFIIRTLPAHGQLFQITGGGAPTLGSQITNVPTTLTDSQHRVGYVPTANYHGTDAFAWVVADAEFESVVANLSVSITPVDDPPVGQPDSFTGSPNVTLTITSVLANDANVDGGTLVIASFTQPANGTVTHQGGGVFAYVPATNFAGTDSFTYVPTNGVLNGDAVTVTIQITGPAQRVWTNPTGGNWSTTANWQGGIVPSSTEAALINVSGNYTVTLDVNVTVAQIAFSAASGTQILNVNGKTLTVSQSMTSNTHGSMTLNTGTASFGAASNITVLNQGGGTLTGAGDFTVTSAYNWTAGTIANGGKLITPVGCTMSGTGITRSIGRIWENGGTSTISGGSPSFIAGGGLNNLSGGTFTIGVGIIGSASNVVNNAGTYVKTGGTGAATQATFNNAGIVRIDGGSLNCSLAPFTQTSSTASLVLNGGNFTTGNITFAAGQITGVGTITATSLINSGATISPSATGTRKITISGAYTQQSGGTLELDLDGVASGSAFDKFAVTGAATLGGTLALRNSVTLNNEVFPLMTHGSRSGGFAAITVTNGGSATANYGTTSSTFTVNAGLVGGLSALALAPSYEEWANEVGQLNPPQPGLAAFGGSIAASAAHAWDLRPLADPDADGLPNLLEYALGGHPLRASSAEAPQCGQCRDEEGDLHLSIAYWRNTSARDLSYVVEFSKDGITWQSNAATPDQPLTALESIAPCATQPTMEWITERMVQPLAGAGERAFLRLRVEQTAPPVTSP